MPALPDAVSRALAALAFLSSAGALAADPGFPVLKFGEWEFTRFSANAPKNVQNLSVKECLDPIASMKEQNAILERAGCKFDPPVVEGNKYTYVARCDIPDAGKSVSRSVLTRESDKAYTVQVESEGELRGKPMKISETLTAKRVGNCKKK